MLVFLQEDKENVYEDRNQNPVTYDLLESMHIKRRDVCKDNIFNMKIWKRVNSITILGDAMVARCCEPRLQAVPVPVTHGQSSEKNARGNLTRVCKHLSRAFPWSVRLIIPERKGRLLVVYYEPYKARTFFAIYTPSHRPAKAD